MELTIKKVGQRDGRDRFVLVDNQSRAVITVHDVSEEAIRRFFRQRKVSELAVEGALVRARRRYDEQTTRRPVDQGADTLEGDELMRQLGLVPKP